MRLNEFFWRANFPLIGRPKTLADIYPPVAVRDYQSDVRLIAEYYDRRLDAMGMATEKHDFYNRLWTMLANFVIRTTRPGDLAVHLSGADVSMLPPCLDGVDPARLVVDQKTLMLGKDGMWASQAPRSRDTFLEEAFTRIGVGTIVLDGLSAREALSVVSTAKWTGTLDVLIRFGNLDDDQRKIIETQLSQVFPPEKVELRHLVFAERGWPKDFRLAAFQYAERTYA